MSGEKKQTEGENITKEQEQDATQNPDDMGFEGTEGI